MNGTADTGIDLTDDRLHEPAIFPGAAVEVRRRFDRAWARGFRVIDTDETGYQLRRESDGAVLPVRFPAADLRLARNVD